MVKIYAFDKKVLFQLKLCILPLILFVCFFVALPFLPDDSPEKDFYENIKIMIVGILLFGGMTLGCLYVIWAAPRYLLSADEDGLWFSHQSKAEGLVSWMEVYQIQERPYSQCLILMNSNGQRLIRIEYQLDKFDELRLTICENVLSRKIPIRLPVLIEKNILFHPLNVLSIIGITILGFYAVYIGEMLPGIILIGFSLSFGIKEYITTPYRMEFAEREIILSSAFKRRIIEYSKILSVELTDTMESGVRKPKVLIHQENAKPVKLQGFPISAADLYCILRAIGLPPHHEIS